MQLVMNSLLAAGYKSRSQIARIVTENWAACNLYCAACERSCVQQSANNARAIDFICEDCKAGYQLKSGERWNEHRIPDAGYNAMVNAIRSDKVPNLLIMQYTAGWRVRNLLLVPSFFFTESCVQKRDPLSASARRAGWIGCNILLSAISPEGKIRLVADEIAMDPSSVRREYKRLTPIANLKVAVRGWALNVLRMVHKVERSQFAIEDIYGFEEELSVLYPGNRNIRPKIRQQLQVLRDIGLIEFLGRGNYRLRNG
ncbi:MAG: restriction endonuclease [Planctomycetes bacterium]|nr:restriction endonuclease [Planctomycetota bacterium]